MSCRRRRRQSIRWVTIVGYLIKHRAFPKFVCWHPYKAVYYWGSKRLSERFFFHGIEPTGLIKKVLDLFPEGKVVCEL